MKLHTQIYNFFEIRSSGFLKNSGIFLKKCQKCVEELKFCMNELFNNVFKAFSFKKFRKVHFDEEKLKSRKACTVEL
jgi:mannose-1-phosphate guanylyltransferase